MPDAVSSPAAPIVVTESAVQRVHALIGAEGRSGLMLRLSVSGGGCSGFQYMIDLDGQTNPDDQVFEEGGIKVVVDSTSLDLLNGSVIDYVEDLIGASFQIRNPNATSTCGCGNSFSV